MGIAAHAGAEASLAAADVYLSRPGLGALVLAGLSVKIGQELINGAVPGAVETIGGEVSLISHALGTMGGALAARGGEWRVRLIIIVLIMGIWPEPFLGAMHASVDNLVAQVQPAIDMAQAAGN